MIVEGYMDVIALAEQGIHNAVATLGTATTPDHLRQLLRSAPEIVFCFDGDRAGREAAWRAAENALPMLGGNHELKFMFLPDGEDPDSIVKQEGAEKFNQRVDQAQSYSDYFFLTLESRVDISSMDGRARLVEIAKPYLRHIPASVYRDMLEQRLAESSKTTMSVLNRHLDKPVVKQNKRKATSSSSTVSPIRTAITILLQHPELYKYVGEYHNIEVLDLPGKNVLMKLLETLEQYPHLNTAALLERWRDDENSSHLQRLALQALSLSADELKHELSGTGQQLQKQALEVRQSYLTNKPFSQLTDAEKEEVKSFS